MLNHVEAMGTPVRASGEESFDMVVPADEGRDFNFTEVTTVLGLPGRCNKSLMTSFIEMLGNVFPLFQGRLFCPTGITRRVKVAASYAVIKVIEPVRAGVLRPLAFAHVLLVPEKTKVIFPHFPDLITLFGGEH